MGKKVALEAGAQMCLPVLRHLLLEWSPLKVCSSESQFESCSSWVESAPTSLSLPFLCSSPWSLVPYLWFASGWKAFETLDPVGGTSYSPA